MRPMLTSLALISILSSGAALGHHSYVMFDMSHRQTVSGTLAKVDWSNPHVSIWVYAHKPNGAPGFDLYGFEAGGVNILSRLGWSPKTFSVGEKVIVDYCPLKDGRHGGALIQVKHADGSHTQADSIGLSPVNRCGVQR